MIEDNPLLADQGVKNRVLTDLFQPWFNLLIRWLVGQRLKHNHGFGRRIEEGHKNARVGKV